MRIVFVMFPLFILQIYFCLSMNTKNEHFTKPPSNSNQINSHFQLTSSLRSRYLICLNASCKDNDSYEHSARIFKQIYVYQSDEFRLH